MLAYNLEIAEAHTYFANELEAWGQNACLGNFLGGAFWDDPIKMLMKVLGNAH